MRTARADISTEFDLPPALLAALTLVSGGARGRAQRQRTSASGRRGVCGWSLRPSACQPTWAERLFGGFRKTSERLSENLTAVVGTARLDEATLDDVEDVLTLKRAHRYASAQLVELLA